MEINVIINTCKDCRYLDHSGAFTIGGERPVCSHRGACYGTHAIPKGSATLVMVDTGMMLQHAERYVARAERDDDGEIDRLLLINHKHGVNCYHWAHRVPFTDWDKPSIPYWCPLKNGASY